MLDSDDFWAIRGKKENMEDYLPIKRGLKPNGLFSSIKRAKEFIKRPNLKPNGLFSSFKRSLDFVDEDELLSDSGMFSARHKNKNNIPNSSDIRQSSSQERRFLGSERQERR